MHSSLVSMYMDCLDYIEPVQSGGLIASSKLGNAGSCQPKGKYETAQK